VEAAIDDIMVTITRPPSSAPSETAGTYPTVLRLGKCVPNPMNPWTRIPFDLPATGPVSIKIFDVGGRLVRDLLENRKLEAGSRAVHWDGRNALGLPVGSGIYYIRLEATNGEDTGTITVLR
jgi:hypothetical protein